MSMDGLSLFAMTQELQILQNGKIDKIWQPDSDTLMIVVRANKTQYKLLLCAHPENGRVQLTEQTRSNPLEPPAFCMLLRKRLTGGRIQSITQPNLDRVLYIAISAENELGDPVIYQLIVELMGKYSNLILINEKETVLDCSKHVGVGMSSVRLLLPGTPYTPAPAQSKKDPTTASDGDFFEALCGNGRISKTLSSCFSGLSPAFAQQLVYLGLGEEEDYAEYLSLAEQKKLASFLYDFYQQMAKGQFSPTLLNNDFNEPVGVYPFRPAFADKHCIPMPSLSAALDQYYLERDMLQRIRQKTASLQRILSNNLERCYKKLAVFEHALAQNESLEELRLYGELITANFHQLKRGMQYAKVMNYYLMPPDFCTIPLDERLSPQENAQHYFKKYQKGKAAKKLAVEQRRETLEELNYLEGQQDNLNKCSNELELSEIRNELIQQGYVKPERTRMKAPKQPPSKPLHYRSSDGISIYVGKNNIQNDTLTLRTAASDNTWLHVKNMPGSHVIIDCESNPPEQTLLEAATLAAYYSKGQNSSSVPVDYCLRKYVKKPSGAKPGMVIYTNQRTLYVTPEESIVKSMQQIT